MVIFYMFLNIMYLRLLLILFSLLFLSGCAVIRASPNTGVERLLVVCLISIGPCYDAADTRTDVEDVDELELTTE